MTRAELIASLTKRQPHLPAGDVDWAARHILMQLIDALVAGRRIEVRGFGVFSVRHRKSRLGRNPKTGAALAIPATRAAHFKPGLLLRERVRKQEVRHSTRR